MKEIAFNVSKADVIEEVMKKSEYIGTKLLSDTDVYDSVRMTEEDAATLNNFWYEAAAVADEKLKEMLTWSYFDGGPTPMDEDYSFGLHVADGYDQELSKSVIRTLVSYFVNTMLAKWLRFTNKDEAEKYAEVAQGMMDETLTMLYSRKRPTRTEVETIEG